MVANKDYAATANAIGLLLTQADSFEETSFPRPHIKQYP